MAQRGRIGLLHRQRVAADHDGQECSEIELRDDLLREAFGLVRDDRERVAALAKCREMRDDARKGLHVDGALSFVVREVLHERRVDLGLGRAVAEYSGDEGARTVADVRTHRGLGKGRQTA